MNAIHISEITPKPGERHLIIGGTRAGKSAIMEFNTREIQASRPECMQIVVDSKPRFRAEKERGCMRRNRRPAAYRYASWAKGPTIPNSVVVDIWDEKPFKNIWSEPGEVAILQGGEYEDWRRILFLLNGFVKAHIKGRERRIVVDEVLDFYNRNTWGIDSKNDVFYRAARAGGERNIGIELGSHRVHGLPPLILNMASRITLFHLRSDSDMRHLNEVGIKDAESPEGDFVFRQWTIKPGGVVSEPFTGRANLPDSYLKQLAPT